MEAKRQNYYGAFFWLSLIAFIVPLVVAVQAFRVALPATKPTPAPDASGVDHALWDYLLKAYVANGLIDYEGMARDYLFRTYLAQLGACDVGKLETDAEKIALLCNAYNAFVVDGVITQKVTGSVMDEAAAVDGTGFFDQKRHIFGGETMSLNHLEHQVIREDFDEPRIHVALVCAAKSCPAIRPEAFVGERLDAQLADQARLFANSPRYVAYDPEKQAVLLSPILDWYGEDWENHGGVLPWLAERVEDAALREAIARVAKGELKVAYSEYDWALNSQATRGTGGARKVEFGSGSIPNE
ncbi:MAG: DUF547 domain-containing protein [Candidatus Hydrogenedentes bacterium]|nr:DUF547 domain-containing protein [Candidatus Hydrogenedentota bacterium]